MFAPYGIFKPTVIVSNGVESFGQSNQTSVTAAANPVFANHPESLAYTFQVAQSRLGILVGGEAAVRGQLEIDFLHVDIASPTVGAFPRLRIAELQWHPVPGTRVVFGQGWDVFSPLNPHGFNLTGALFYAGNSGFMRHQAYVVTSFGSIEVAAGAGLPGFNNTASLGALEADSVPSGVLRVSWRRGNQLWVGASMVGSSLKYTKADLPGRRRTSAAGNVFAEMEIAGANLKLEAFGAQNGANVGLITLGAGRYDANLYELGGYLSARRAFGGPILACLSFGAATVLNDEDMVPAYSVPAGASAPVRNGLGIAWNLHGRASLAYSLAGMSVFLEPFVTVTRHVLATQDAARYSPRRVAGGVETGLFYKF